MATITSDNLKKEDALQVGPPLVDTNDYPSTTKANADYLTKLTTDSQAKTDALNIAQTNDVNSANKITSDMALLLGKTADTQTAEDTAGVTAEQNTMDTYNQRLNDLTASASALSNESKAIPLKVQQENANTGATDAGVAPITTGRLRENAIKSLTIASEADAITAGVKNSAIRLAAAKDKAQRAIDLKYKPIEDEIANLKATLELNTKYITDPAEKKALAAQKSALDEKVKQEADKKATEKSISDIGADALKFGASKDVYDAIVKAKDADGNPSVSAALIAAKGYLSDPLEAKYKLAQINSLNTKTTNSVTGTGGAYQPIDTSKITDKNVGRKEFGGLSFNALNNNAQLFLANSGKLPSLGLGQAADVKTAKLAIQNYAGQIADSLGLNLPQISAMYKANSKAATDIVNRVAKVDATSNALANQFPRLAELADKVGGLGIQESDLTKGKAELSRKFGSVDAANYIELIQTVRSDYAAMQAAIGGSKGGQFFSQSAVEAIPLGLTSDQYKGLQQTIQLSAINAQQGTSDEANKLIGNIGAPALYSGYTLPTDGSVNSYQGFTLPTN